MTRREESKILERKAEIEEAISLYENGANFCMVSGYAGYDFSEYTQEIIYSALKTALENLNGGEKNG